MDPITLNHLKRILKVVGDTSQPLSDEERIYIRATLELIIEFNTPIDMPDREDQGWRGWFK